MDNTTAAPEAPPAPVPEAPAVAADVPAKELNVGALHPVQRYVLLDAAYADLLPKAQAVLNKALDGQLNSEPHRDLTLQVALSLICGRL